MKSSYNIRVSENSLFLLSKPFELIRISIMLFMLNGLVISFTQKEHYCHEILKGCGTVTHHGRVLGLIILGNL